MDSAFRCHMVALRWVRLRSRFGHGSLVASFAWATTTALLLVALLFSAGWTGRQIAAAHAGTEVAWLDADRALYRLLNQHIGAPHTGFPFTTLNHPGLDYLVVAAVLIGYCARRGRRDLALALAAIAIALAINVAATWEVQRAPPRERPFVLEHAARTPVHRCDGPLLIGSRTAADPVAGCDQPAVAGQLRGVDWSEIWGKYPSFPSGHMRETAALCVLLVAFWRRSLPFAVSLLALMGYSRVLFGAHYPTDVLGGTAIGIWSGAVTLAAVAAARHAARRLVRVPHTRRSWEYVAQVRQAGRPDLDPLPARLTRAAVGVVAANLIVVALGIAGGNAWAENVLELLDDTHTWIGARLPVRPAPFAPALSLAAAFGLALAAASRGNGKWSIPSHTALLALAAAAALACELLILGSSLFARAPQDVTGSPDSSLLPALFPDPFPLFAAALVSAIAPRSRPLALTGRVIAALAAVAGVLAGTATIHAALAGYVVGAAAGPLALQLISQFVPPSDTGARHGAGGTPSGTLAAQPPDADYQRAGATA